MIKSKTLTPPKTRFFFGKEGKTYRYSLTPPKVSRFVANRLEELINLHGFVRVETTYGKAVDCFGNLEAFDNIGEYDNFKDAKIMINAFLDKSLWL